MRIRLDGEAAQERFGRHLATFLHAPSAIYLKGDLGTGKTTVTRGVLRGLGHTGAVRSPTYTLLEPYELDSVRLYHLDLYRLGDPEEIEYLGLRDLLDGDSLLFVEWPERGGDLLPVPDLIVEIQHAGDGRILDLVAVSPRGEGLVAQL